MSDEIRRLKFFPFLLFNAERLSFEGACPRCMVNKAGAKVNLAQAAKGYHFALANPYAQGGDKGFASENI